jgi:hypothetical protein
MPRRARPLAPGCRPQTSQVLLTGRAAKEGLLDMVREQVSVGAEHQHILVLVSRRPSHGIARPIGTRPTTTARMMTAIRPGRPRCLHHSESRAICVPFRANFAAGGPVACSSDQRWLSIKNEAGARRDSGSRLQSGRSGSATAQSGACAMLTRSELAA